MLVHFISLAGLLRTDMNRGRRQNSILRSGRRSNAAPVLDSASHMRRNQIKTTAGLFATLSLSLLSSCDFGTPADDRSFGLSDGYRIDKTRTLDLEGYEAEQGQILGALEMLYGTPKQPRFLMLSEWADEGYDPNEPSWAADDGGSGEIDAAEFERIIEDNARVFRPQLKAIAAGDYDAVVPFRGAPRLQEDWDFLLADYVDGEFETEDAFKEEAEALLLEWYPSFVDSADLYRLECMHCHGTEGMGDGSTAPFLEPRPRNYQPGIFKWTALKDKAHPRRQDLYNIISDGAYTSAMPSFRRFSRAQIHGMVDMVRLLSIRGETEKLLAYAVHEDGDGGVITPDIIVDTYRDVWEKWDTAAEKLITFDGEVPMPTAERIAHGRKLFMDKNAGNCSSCHGDLGLGDGASAWEVIGGVSQRVVDDWGFEIQPRNLTTGIFRGGRRPIDIYRRITAGINGTPMPAAPDILTPEDRWDLVHYVLSLSEVHDGAGLDSMRMRMSGHDAEETHNGGH
jgi:mono/diheme cytochrome c family protein